VSLLGGGGGPQTSFTRSDPPSTTVGSDPIVVLCVYYPSGRSGPGNGDAGASIDAWDESTGNLLNDFFVKVSPDDPDGAGPLTESGNVHGWVDTTNGPEEITADSPLTPSATTFDRWVDLENPQPETGSGFDNPRVFTAPQGASYSLAFYRKPTVFFTIPGKLWPTVIFEDPFGNVIARSLGDSGKTIIIKQGIPNEDID
jgi:hypothetical protein